MMSPTVIKTMPQPIGLFAADLFGRGIQYLDAAAQLDYKCNKNSLMPGSFLISHAIELFLKSYLAATGTDKKTIRCKYGHLLTKTYAACLQEGLPKVENLDELIENMHEMNREHDFRYPTGYKLLVIAPPKAIEITKILTDEIRPLIGRISLDAQLQFAADTRHLRGTKIEWSD